MSERPTVVFRCDAGREDGLGHVMRCLVLADAFREQGAGTLFLTATGEGMVGAERIAARGHDVEPAPERIAGPADRDFLMARLTGRSATALVIDGKRADADYTGAARRLALTLVIDDDALHDFRADFVLNALGDAAPGLYPAPIEGRELLTGPRFNLVAPQYFEMRRPLAGTVARMLVTMGGEDPADHTSRIIELLAPAFPEIAIEAVVGPAHPAPEGVECVAASLPNVRLTNRPASLVPSIEAADVAISAGGTTCYELAAAGVPFLAVLIEDHQRRIVEPMAAAGATSIIATETVFDPAAVRTAVEDLVANTEGRAAMRKAAETLMPGPGAPEIARRVLDRLQQAKEAA